MNQDLVEKYRDLYERSKEVLTEDLNRFYRADEKASKYITALTFLVGIYGFFADKIISDICRPSNLVEWLLYINLVVSLALIVWAWFAVFRVLRLHSVYKVKLNNEVIQFYDKNRLIDVYYAFSRENADTINNNRVIIDSKLVRLKNAYNLIEGVVISSVFLAVIFGAYKFLDCDKNKLPKMDVISMSNDENYVPKGKEELTEQGPNPNIQAPKNELIQEGYKVKSTGEIKETLEKGVIEDKD